LDGNKAERENKVSKLIRRVVDGEDKGKLLFLA